MICPNIHIKEVKDGFNEMVEALGGRPLTDEEFKSSELRNQRTGLNYAAMEAAYRTYHRNNGNMLDKAPNGKDSVLFNSLLEHFKGNRKEAIKAKANVYTDEFFNWFGNWTGSDQNKPVVTAVLTEYANLGGAHGDAIAKILEKYDLKDVQHLFLRPDPSGKYNTLTKELSVPALYKDDPEHVIQENKKVVLHELIHVLTSKFLFLYVREKGWAEDIYGGTHEEIKVQQLSDQLVKAIEKLYEIRDAVKKYIKDEIPNLYQAGKLYQSASYFLIEEGDEPRLLDEFVAEVFSNPNLQIILKQISYKSGSVKTNVFYQFVECIKSILGIPVSNTLLDEAISAIEVVSSPLLKESKLISKVVDDNGEPLMVWHGGSLVKVFNTTGKYISAGIEKGDVGAYFTTSKKSAKKYENIHDYKYGDAVFTILEELKESGLSDEEIDKEWNTSMLDVRSGTRAFFLNIKNPKQTYYSGNREKGYVKTDTNTENVDGQVITREDTEEVEYVAFNPNQIKSATSNKQDIVTGEPGFSTTDDNVYHHKNEHDALKDILFYIEDYIENKFGYGHSYNEIKNKVEELEKQFGVLEIRVVVSNGKTKLNFKDMHFAGSPASRESKISKIYGTEKDVYNSILILVSSINRLFPNLDIHVKEDRSIPQGSAYYDRLTNTIHYCPIIIGNFNIVNRLDIVEECLHPLIACIAATDKELFNSLLRQAIKDKGLVSYIKNAYRNSPLYIIEQEIVTQAISRMYANNTYENLLSIDEFQRKEHARRFAGIISLIKQWVDKIKSLIEGNKILVKNSDFSTVISSLDSIVDILNTKGIEFTEVTSRYMSAKMWHAPSTNNSVDKIKKSAEKIRHRFGVLYKTYEKMPNKSLQRLKQANEIFELYGEIKRLDNFDAVTKAMDFAEKKLGLLDDSDQHPGVLLWLEKQEQNGFVDVTAELLVDLQLNTIGFFKNLLTYFPPDSYMTEDAIDQRNKISGYIENTIGALWAKAAYAVSDRIVDDLVDRWFTGQDEDRDGMKEVAKDWLHKNAMYGDISSMASFLQNYQYSSNPITKQVFHLILVAETKTGIELLPISAKISKAYRKANKEFGKLNPAWQKIFMEFDKDGIPTGNFVRDINYGQYQKDVDEFINDLNQRFLTKYNHSYYIDEDGTYINTLTGGFADDEEWIDGNPPHIVEYRLEIERFKCERSNRRYTFEYYKERMSEPYSGPDPVLTGITGNFKHGLSPKTLSKYNRIQSNINYYMSLCYDKESGVSHPEKLSDEDWIKLESFRREAEELQNPYNADGTIKTGEDYQCAIEIRAWEKWIGDKLESQVDITKFWEESQEILKNEGPDAYDRFVRYNSRFGINPNFLAQTLGRYGSSDAYAAAIHAKLLRSSLQSLVKSKKGYTRDLAVQENNPLFWIECKKTDQIIEDNRRKRDKDFFIMMSENFDHDLIQYTDVYGNAYDEQDNILPNNAAPDIVRMTWFDHMINKYTADIFNSPSRTKPGLYDPSTGQLVVFNGTADEVREQVYKLFTYVRTVHNEDGTSERVREPLTIFSMMTPVKDTFFNEREGRVEYTMINVPTGRFSTKVDRFNKYMSKPDVYDYNSPIQELPKREFYDNSEAFNKVKGSAKDLYGILTTVCENTQRLYKQNGSLFNYRLPMINADVMMLLSRLKSDGYKNVSRAVFDEITGITENDENMRTASQFATNPDGTIATDVPLKFIRPLEDMRRLSTDISSMVVLFAEMGLNYKNKQQIDSTIKALRYNMDSDVREYLSKQADEEYQLNDNKNATEQFDNMTNIHMYGNDWHFKKDVNQPYDKATVAGLKIAKYIQRYESTHMLGLNILSMLVGACDAGVKQFRETLNGKYARPLDLVKGLARCIEHTPKAIMNIGCPLANNKLTALMQMLRISKGTRATYEHMNWSRLKKIGAQFLMGGFSMLDYMMNGLLLMSHMSNVRLYNSDGHDSEIPAGFYTLYELQQQFIKVGRKKSLATLTHLMLHEDLYNAFLFSSQDGCCYVKDEYKPYINDDVLTMIRTKTLSRGALYNGMNPDNDQPKARKIIWSSFLLSMRGWITQATEHMFSGGTDNIPITKELRTEYLTRYGITRLMNFDVIHDLTNEQRSKRLAWNYETGTPQDLIFVGLARCVKTTWRYLMTNAFRNIQDNDPRKVKFSYVEKYACKDALIWFIVLCVMLATWPLVNSAAGALPPPKKDDPMLLTNPYKYMTDVYFPNGYYRLLLADIYFRTIESLISSVDPTTMLDFITSASVLYSAYREQADFLMAGSDLLGMGDGSLDETVKTGGYINYTKATRVFAKGTGFLDNLHTAFDFYGTDANLKFYTGKYGKIYRWLGYDYKRKYGRVILGYSPSNFGPGFKSGPPISSGPGFTSGPPAKTGPRQ